MTVVCVLSKSQVTDPKCNTLVCCVQHGGPSYSRYSNVYLVPVQSLNLTTPTDNSIYVRVTDSCPCLQFDGGSDVVTGTNPACCGNVNHFDLSFFGFEKLAHPVYGVMNTEFRWAASANPGNA